MAYVAHDVEPDVGDIYSGTRQCRVCRVSKPMEEFYFTSNKNRSRYRKCKTCYNDQARAWRDANWPAVQAASKKRDLRLKYGITFEELNEMQEMQGQRCALCRDEFSNEVRTHIDHDHGNGRVRGLLCPRCNRGLGQFRDDPELLRRAAAYVEAGRKEEECNSAKSSTSAI